MSAGSLNPSAILEATFSATWFGLQKKDTSMIGAYSILPQWNWNMIWGTMNTSINFGMGRQNWDKTTYCELNLGFLPIFSLQGGKTSFSLHL